MDSKLFLIEIIVTDIRFEPTFQPIPLKSQVLINVRFSDIMNIDIDPEEFEHNPVDQTISNPLSYNNGKTYLFTYMSNELTTELKRNPLEISLRVFRKTEGMCMLPWKKEFIDMVKIFETIGIVKSVDFNGAIDLVTRDETKIGAMSIYMRMSCYGDNIETACMRINDDWTFMNPKTMKMFKCARYEPHVEEITPIGVIYNPMLNQKYPAANISWTELFGNSAVDKLSIVPPTLEETESGAIPKQTQSNTVVELLAQSSAFDVVSMVFRPEENKFFDFLNLVSAEVTTKQDETMVTLKLDKTQRPSLGSTEVEATLLENIRKGDDSQLELTAKKIEEKLCKNWDCPAVQKFKEFGIGPLAPGKGLGTLYGHVKPPVNYGMSHTYGTMDTYGPYGVFTRPKSRAEPFSPPSSTNETNVCSCMERKRKKSRRNVQYLSACRTPAQLCSGCLQALHSGCDRRESDQNSGPVEQEGVMRLRGGGGGACFDSEVAPRGRHGCNGVSLDQILKKLSKEHTESSLGFEKYTRQPTTRNEKREVRPSTSLGLDRSHNCRLRDGGCSSTGRLRGGAGASIHSGEFNNTQATGPKSPIAECRSIMNQFDQILTAYKKALGPCGETTCPYAGNLADENCKKMCDMMKQKSANQPVEQRDSVSCQSVPCGMEACVYKERPKAFPSGCGSPKCAYTKYKLGLVDDDAALELQFLPPAVAGKCGHPKCPYPFPPDLPPIHWDCPDPLPPKGVCRNPNCPFQPSCLKKVKCPQPKGPCGSVDCPFALPPPCDVPTCPFRQIPCPFLEKEKEMAACGKSSSSDTQNAETCDNPECPFAKSEKPNPKNISRNKNTNGDNLVCENSDCPSKNRRKLDNPDNKYEVKRPSLKPVGRCGDPNCPFPDTRSKEDPQICFDQEGDGDAPDEEKCPKKEADCIDSDPTCENPDCPFMKQKQKPEECTNPACPYFHPLPSCGIPGCPYEPVPTIGCPNAVCLFDMLPKPEEKCPKKEADCIDSDPTCENPNCPFMKQKQKPEECEPVPTVDCPNAVCPINMLPRPAEKAEVAEVTVDVDDVCDNEDCDNPECEGFAGAHPDDAETPSKRQSKKRKKKGIFVYSMGNKYPGVKIGHRECVSPVCNVPPKMGWLWNIFTPMLQMKPRRGWKPGAVQKTIARRIRAHRRAKGLGMVKVPNFPLTKSGLDGEFLDVKPRPTLHIQKKNGAYWVTMNPLKDPMTLVDNEDPYMECSPMQFRITKKPKRDDDASCSCSDNSSASSSSESELDIEFTPPAGIIHPERFKKKKNVTHCDTQYDPGDFEVKKPAKEDKKDGKKKDKKGKDTKGKKGGKGKGKKKGK